MEVFRIEEFTRGWFIGNFEPSLFVTKNFEVGLLSHSKGEIWPKHYHKSATEYNLLISGLMKIQGKTIKPGDIFILNPGEIADPEFIDDCKIVVIKSPSVSGDKFEV
jgi:quercetin dioxygenase-like cupin family protein